MAEPMSPSAVIPSIVGAIAEAVEQCEQELEAITPPQALYEDRVASVQSRIDQSFHLLSSTTEPADTHQLRNDIVADSGRLTELRYQHEQRHAEFERKYRKKQRRILQVLCSKIATIVGPQAMQRAIERVESDAPWPEKTEFPTNTRGALHRRVGSATQNQDLMQFPTGPQHQRLHRSFLGEPGLSGYDHAARPRRSNRRTYASVEPQRRLQNDFFDGPQHEPVEELRTSVRPQANTVDPPYSYAVHSLPFSGARSDGLVQDVSQPRATFRQVNAPVSTRRPNRDSQSTPINTMEARSQECFTLFPKLPLEIRMMIWEETWPPPRIIEATVSYEIPAADDPVQPNELEGLEVPSDHGAEAWANATPRYAESENSVSLDNYLRLRLAGSLSTFQRIETNSRIYEEEKPFEHCPLPSVLQVCRESRAHALTHFMFLKDSKIESYSFYFNPRRDIVWLSMDVTEDGVEKVDLLRDTYGQQLAAFRNILVHESDWGDPSGLQYCENFFGIFGGLNSVTILLQDEDWDSQPPYTRNPHDLHSRAKELEQEDLAILRSGIFKGTLHYVGRDGSVYGRLPWAVSGHHGTHNHL